MQARKKTLYIPLINLSNKALKWEKGRDLTTLEPILLPQPGNAGGFVCGVDEEPLIPLPDEVKKNLTIGEHLTPTQREELLQLLDRYSVCFDEEQETAPAHGIEHRIDTGDSPPIGTTPHRTSAFERQLINNQVQDMLEKGIIEKSNSPWAAPVVMVPKRDGSRRFCVDYRSINARTRRDLYPLPRVDEILEKMAGTSDKKGQNFMTSLDLKNGFW